MANVLTIKDTKVAIGDTVRVMYHIFEKEEAAGKTKKEKKTEIRERIQPFEGIVIAIQGSTDSRSFIVRRIGAGNIGIERIFPAASPWIDKIVVTKNSQVKRAKLYYLRDPRKMSELKTGSSTDKSQLIAKSKVKETKSEPAKNSQPKTR